jgi:hypothetical protein
VFNFSKRNNMSLVNSLINQVGREMGRDLYWSVKGSLLSVNESNGNGKRNLNLTPNGEVLNFLKKKKWNSKMRFSAVVEDLKNVVDLVDEKTDPRSFDWREVYAELDNKIDELKLTCSDEESLELEEIDKKNYINYSIAMGRHKTWISKQLEEMNEYPKPPSRFLIFILSPFGLTSSPLKRGGLNAVAEVLCAVIWWSLIVFGIRKLQYDTATNGGWGAIVIGFSFYLLVLLGDFISLGDLKKRQLYHESQMGSLRTYLNSLS